MTARIRQVELDGLRLIGLGRIPLCARCPRYADLVDRYMGSQAPATRLAQVPEDCAHLYCAPLVERFDSSCPPQPAVVERRAVS